MKNTLGIAVGTLIIVGIVGAFALKNSGAINPNTAQSLNKKDIVATIYKSPTCGCCGVYTSYMKKEGYTVNVENVDDMASVKEMYEIPSELGSCHTMEIAGYVVEGHIPEEAILKLLTEKPDIKGIGMAGMPSGSPGMPGPKLGDFVIYEIHDGGMRGDVFMTI